jgi:protein-S-isoprenylcysteine O-methyltransferase Ste14
MNQKPLEVAGMVINGLSIALFFFLASVLDVPQSRPIFAYAAWLLFAIGLALVLLSTMTLAAKRAPGLIDRGIYGIVRHPMYLGAMLLFLSWIFFLPHGITVLLSSVNAAIVYGFILQGERANIERFGDAYRRYMDEVPRINLFRGLLRYLRTQ